MTTTAALPSSSQDLLERIRALTTQGEPLDPADVDALEAALAAPQAILENLQDAAATLKNFLRDTDASAVPPEVFTQLSDEAKTALVTLHGLANSPMRIHARDAKEAVEFVTRALLNANSGTGSYEPVALDAHGLRAMDFSIRDLKNILELAHDYDLDEMQQQSLLNAIETMELRKRWKAAPEAA
jgi:hypothetical protein